MKKKSFRFQLISSTASIIMGVIVLFSSILILYMIYYLMIIGRIYAMDEDLATPIATVVAGLLIVLLVVALIASIGCGIVISNRFLKTVKQFIDNVQKIKKEGFDHRLKIEGDDELARLGKEFNETIGQAQQALMQQDQFVSDASHELKTPLAIIKGNIEMLQRWGKDDPEVLNNALQVTHNEVERLTQLCSELLHLTREMKIECKEPVNVELVVNEIINNFKEVHPEFDYQLFISSNELVWMQTEHLKQLLIILLDNAIKYAREESKRIEILYDGKQLTIKDYGIGIEKDKINHIFDRFYRADESRVQSDNNFGLGLAIAKRIVNEYGYTIKVASEVNRYSEFMIKFIGSERNEKDY
ncbi:cell wall metabolism sensor histidine kinase WalK [Thomasclavelia sp.]|uniref:sensor histidine kinase n=1 Tax=Thomasclavelia sp. TaxID=3025757 RepID=UPI0025F735FF|nr:HAMP domain-containing sensor histidine kinase [Thomasclavelia sp.]